MPQRSRPVTITDVARHARVSITTVSFVLNETPAHGIPEETVERVRAAARELGYRPNASAKQLRTSQSHTIGLIVDQVATTPFAGNIIRGAQDAAWARGKMLIMVNTSGIDEIRDTAIELMLERRVEGLIFASMYHRVVDMPDTSTWEVPVVLADCFDSNEALPSVVPDEIGGGRTATTELIKKGHRRIGLINLDPIIIASVGRHVGYQEALRDHGIAYDGELVRYIGVQTPGRSYQCARELLALPERPTALFCGNDRAAMEAYAAIADAGLRVPGDVAVIGFDNMELIAAHLRPALSTVELPHYDMGRWAVETLFDEKQIASDPAVRYAMPCPYIERNSA